MLGERVDEEPRLRGVRRDDANVARFERRVLREEVADDLDDNVDFAAVESRLAVELFGVVVRDGDEGFREEGGAVGGGGMVEEPRTRWGGARAYGDGVLEC